MNTRHPRAPALPARLLSHRALALAAALLAAWLSLDARAASAAKPEQYGGREMLVVTPSHPAPAHALVLVLHGGLGNAGRIADGKSESALNLDALAEQHGFYVAYLNGTQVGRRLPESMRGWNAGGGCCGLPYSEGVDDVAYITGAVQRLVEEYGLDARQVYGFGHSNGAIMVQRLLCESEVLAAGVAVSGPLTLDVARCPKAAGRRVLAIHGVDDANVPVAGGVGSKGVSKVDFKSEAYAQQLVQASGGSYTLELVPGADHAANHIDAALKQLHGRSLGEEAVAFLGLASAGAP
jgi:poly(3-hydroxybutyrate) depolymerase